MGSMKRVLIVEDEETLRRAYKTILTKEDYKVAEASNGREALKILKEFKPDLILLDILMPVMDGHTFLQKAKLKEIYPHVKVIAFSNLSNQQKLEEMETLGICRYALKSSMSPKQLVDLIKEVLAL